jgi:hypothetical protein
MKIIAVSIDFIIEELLARVRVGKWRDCFELIIM